MLLSITFCHGQHGQVSFVPSYNIFSDNAYDKKIIVTMPYGKADVLKVDGDTAKLEMAGALMIEVICTDYPSSASLTDLNDRRVKAIFSIFPYLDSKQIQNIQVVRQMEGLLKVNALEMFHGVVIHYRPRQSKETMKHDLEELGKLLGEEMSSEKITEVPTSPIIADGKERLVSTLANKSDTSSTPAFIQVIPGRNLSYFKKNGHDDNCLHIITPKAALGLGYMSREDYEKTWKKYKVVTVAVCYAHAGKEASSLYLSERASEEELQITNQESIDSTLQKVFTRNKWRRMSVAADLTGSMYPYTAQLLIWMKLQSLDSFSTQYIFFNDGNEKQDHEKVIGSTGGIYSNQSGSFTEVLETIKTCMSHGGGGDSPENDIEALLEAEKTFSEAQFHVLIADNWAPVKDLQLANRLSKPVRIVLCGVYDGWINLDYLNLARLTGGSVHLMEVDINNLASLHEGESIKIGRKSYKIIDGKFVDMGEIKENSL
jgi:hypothetical protein